MHLSQLQKLETSDTSNYLRIILNERIYLFDVDVWGAGPHSGPDCGPQGLVALLIVNILIICHES